MNAIEISSFNTTLQRMVERRKAPSVVAIVSIPEKLNSEPEQADQRIPRRTRRRQKLENSISHNEETSDSAPDLTYDAIV